VNIGVVELSEETMRALHLPPYEAVVKEGVASIMPSFTAWKRNGVEIKSTIDKYLLTDMLKNGLKWDGFCLSDWDAIPRAFTDEEYPDEKAYIEKAVNAGVDMAMISKFHPDAAPQSLQHSIDYRNNYKQLIDEKLVSTERLNDAVKRILRIKFRMKLFENPKSNPSLKAEFGSSEHRKVARESVRKSLVLLKNEGNVLPLKKSEKIVVVGKWGNSLGAQCGGWTISWQGAVDNPDIVGTTIFKGLQEVGGTSNVNYDENGNNLSSADKIVLVLGEVPYSESNGDHGNKGRDNFDISKYYKNGISIHLADCPNYDLLAKCVATNKPVILVLISGRPLIIKEEDLNKVKALVAAWLPGSEGGGVADVLYGDYNFTGKLTHTWPRSFDQIPINAGPQYADEKKGSGGTPLFEYGFGLKY
ncbi:MAG: glycoside hydrolase family 3 C-terminal domain-containing protein, partial [Chitinispirillaceae bacterium]|nr:glycoside hydrolase family 3 C-terminal domain-containing protein [Chitinispirillaceae bacterium]